MERRVILALVSGGIDSTAAALRAREEFCDEPRSRGEEVECFLYAASFLYGQSHGKEVECAKRFAERYGFKHILLSIGTLSARALLGVEGAGSALTGDKPIPEATEPGRVPETYVPQRNLVLLSYAASVLEMLIELHKAQLGIISVGFQAGDSAPGEPIYPDTRREFVDAVELAINLGSGATFERRARIIVYAPWVDYPKWRVIEWCLRKGVDLGETWTCYRGGEKPCGRCPACIHRLRSFVAAGSPDPLTPAYETLPRWYSEWVKSFEACRAGDEAACSRAREASARARRNEIPS